jgi:hypothetical protein
MPETLGPMDVIAAATIVESALRPVAERDWSVRAGPLEWNVEETITHMLAAVAKYTIYLASRSEQFIALAVTRWPDAANAEVVDAVVPVATGLAAVAAVTPPADLCRRVLAERYRGAGGPSVDDPWHGLVAITGRTPRS